MKNKTFEWSLEKGDLLPLLMMLPTLIIIVCIMVAPLFYGLFLSFFDLGFADKACADKFLGFANYKKFFNDAIAIKATLNTIIFSFGAIFGNLILGTLISQFLLKIKHSISAILRPILIMPLLISPVVVGLIWRYIYDPNGILYWFLNVFGLSIEDFPGVTSASTALFSTIIAQWWQVTPFVIIVLTAGMLSIPESYYESAEIDGAGPFRIFFQITLPQLKNVYMVILLISGVDTFKVFDIIYSLTGGGPNNSSLSLSIYAYSQAFDQSHLSYSMAISFMTMLFTYIIFGIPFVKNNLSKGER
ncbi:MAG: sugar ABC transporter permease [Sphaerochaetaceae bacterium]|nr:sugar ABC transporter permease [Sphaerochaetaceae bacterium]